MMYSDMISKFYTLYSIKIWYKINKYYGNIIRYHLKNNNFNEILNITNRFLEVVCTLNKYNEVVDLNSDLINKYIVHNTGNIIQLFKNNDKNIEVVYQIDKFITIIDNIMVFDFIIPNYTYIFV